MSIVNKSGRRSGVATEIEWQGVGLRFGLGQAVELTGTDDGREQEGSDKRTGGHHGGGWLGAGWEMTAKEVEVVTVGRFPKYPSFPFGRGL